MKKKKGSEKKKEGGRGEFFRTDLRGVANRNTKADGFSNQTALQTGRGPGGREKPS